LELRLVSRNRLDEALHKTAEALRKAEAPGKGAMRDIDAFP
jgi:hypothetical protein